MKSMEFEEPVKAKAYGILWKESMNAIAGEVGNALAVGMYTKAMKEETGLV